MECPSNRQSSVWSLGEVKYKGMDRMRTKIMEHIYIYGYALGVLFLIGLILFTWVDL
jgi:hypothetical protein